MCSVLLYVCEICRLCVEDMHWFEVSDHRYMFNSYEVERNDLVNICSRRNNALSTGSVNTLSEHHKFGKIHCPVHERYMAETRLPYPFVLCSSWGVE